MLVRFASRTRHERLLDRIEQDMTFDRRAIARELIREGDVDWQPPPVNTVMLEQRLTQHGVSGLVPHLPEHRDVVLPVSLRLPAPVTNGIPRLRPALSDDARDHLRYIHLAH